MHNKQKLITFLGISMIMASSIGLLTQKITLENYYKEKFEILINRVIPKDQYLVNVDIKLSDGSNEKESSRTLNKLDKKTSVPEIEEKKEEQQQVVRKEEDFFDLFGNNVVEEPEKEEQTTENKEENTQQNKEIQKIKEELVVRVGVLEKWRHVLIGCSIVAGFILHKMVNMS